MPQKRDPPLYDEARSALAAADTMTALARLRELVERRPHFAPGWGLLGRVLAEASGSVGSDMRKRVEAEKALRRALQLDPDNPTYLLSLGLLKRKQQVYIDARRMLDRAIEALERDPGALPPGERAELWYQRGLFYEDRYLDTRHLVFAPTLPVGSNCGFVPTFCLNFTDPVSFNAILARAADLSGFGDDDFDRMAGAYRRALAADPTHAGAFRRLAVHLIDRGDYRAAVALAHDYLAAAPDEPWGHLVLGIVYERTGRDSLAGLRFDRALALAPRSLAAHLRDISAVLRADGAAVYSAANDAARKALEARFWERSDPLYLTERNELRTAHLARVAFADVMFEDPTTGRWGSETEQGVIYVRYGPPHRIWQVPRDVSREVSAADLLVGADGVPAEAQGGGRWIFWNYGWAQPNFIFQKRLGWRRVAHQFDSFSKAFEEKAREAAPMIVAAPFEIVDYPAQIARFRGEAEGLVALDVYSRVPSLWLDWEMRIDSLDAGLFVFAEPDGGRVVERRVRVSTALGKERVTYSVDLPPGRYAVSVEARAGDGPAAVRRAAVELVAFPDDRLSLSDIVLARTVTPLSRRREGRRDFAIDPNPWLALEPDDPVAVYWEVYGLTTEADRLARYRVTLSVTGEGGTGVLAKVAEALGEALGLAGSSAPQLSYDRAVVVRGDRVPEYLSLELALDDPGPHTLRIEVTDLLSGATAVAERRFEVRGWGY
jgi:GWxTD domain-containing protein